MVEDTKSTPSQARTPFLVSNAYQPVSQILMMEPIPGDFPTRSGHRSVKWWEASPGFLYPPNPYCEHPPMCDAIQKIRRQNQKKFSSPLYPPNLWAGPSAESSLQNGASNEIKEIKVCKKCPKVKPYCAPIFYPIMFKPFLDDT